MIKRIIPSTGEKLPVIGLGTWQTFDISNHQLNPLLENVLRKLNKYGGSLIDSSPMYGLSEQLIGDLMAKIENPQDYFYATKVWTTGLQAGIQQMEHSMVKMRVKTMDLMQIHNLQDWKTHLPQLKKWKEEGRIRYIGITHYTDSSHTELENIMKAENIDFVQFNYSIDSRHAEKRLLDAAADLGVATLINRPYGEGSLFQKVHGKRLPHWCYDLGIDNWSDYFLKYILMHPAVTCIIPATNDPVHAKENFNAGFGAFPDSRLRNKMTDYLQDL
ncbi:Aldo/keto reductase [Pedobacter westerhofensis]|uniref:Aldo/keto reductase n=1 Tax=Pedobacter westerhofensis TaxID=425512 RepID=A0A521F4E1_9SPHI|nr:aldo/keto reductase [Pedobacter westerhofensis]SMO90390.1 Aldo/keto reductase [Pedobacter westerhofensis]